MKLKGALLTFVYTHTLLYLALLPRPYSIVIAQQAGSGSGNNPTWHQRHPSSNRSEGGPLWRRQSEHQPSAFSILHSHRRRRPREVAKISRRSDNDTYAGMQGLPKVEMSEEHNSSSVIVVDSTITGDVEDMRARRIQNIISALEPRDKDISLWLSSLDADGKWPDDQIDYTTGCAARRANWPAQIHWRRISTMAAAWQGSLSGVEQFAQKSEVKDAISRAMDYWFGRDFLNDACLDKGRTDACPCDNPNNWLWNTNWYSNVILIPSLVAQTTLVLGSDNLTQSQLDNVIRMTSRSFNYRHKGSDLTGANLLDISRLGMDQALLTGNYQLLVEAYGKGHSELQIVNTVRGDGIRADGAFAQHFGILYNGNYGKDYANDVLGIEIESVGTKFAADEASQAAFGTLFEGNKWMVVRNAVSDVLHWDFSVLGRFISFPVKDGQATSSININLSLVSQLGQKWNSPPLINFANSLHNSTPHANAGYLLGNRNFYTNDYMVHRGSNYVSTLKMWSTRTRNTECTNSQNPFGFHLADGVTYNYIRGNEYEDIAAAWDWNLIPGITTDYDNSPLTCSTTKLLGLENFVGGVSDGKIGIAVMRYTNPATGALKWQKTWFYLEHDVQHIMVADIQSTSDKPVYSVLDQRRRSGDVIINDVNAGMGFLAFGETNKVTDGMQMLWHGDVGYTLWDGLKVVTQTGLKTGDWSKIGISTQPPVVVDLFTAWVEHERDGESGYPPIEYTVFPGRNYAGFLEGNKKTRRTLKTLSNDENISAVFDEKEEVLMAVFWRAAGGDVTLESRALKVAVDGNSAVIYRLKTGEVTVADPGQTVTQLSVTVSGSGDGGEIPDGQENTLVFSLPTGGLAGSSVTLTLPL